MDADLDEETQLALALSISEAETAGKAQVSSRTNPNQLPRAQPQQQRKTDAELARELQQEFDQEAAAAITQHNSNNNNSSNSNIVVSPDPGCCAGCHQPLVTPQSKPSSGLFGSLAASLVGTTQTRFLTALGKNWHPQCLKCSICHKPLSAQFTVSDSGEPMHPSCHQAAFHPRCTVCSNFLPKEPGLNRIVWQVSPFWGDKTCPAHATDGTKRCTACQRLQPHSEQWADLDDGRALCLLCLGTVVPNTDAAQHLYDSILEFYSRSGMQLPTRPPLSLVNNSALNTATGQQGANRTDGPIFHTRGLCLTEYSQMVRTTVWLGIKSESVGPKKCSVTAILVLSGLPRLLTGCILAHELMHAWLRLSGFEDLPLEVEEGLCQLMALLWLEAQPESQGSSSRSANSGGIPRSYDEKLASYLGNQIRTDASIVYGDGLRAALEAFQRHGLATVLAHVRHAKRLP
jgi:Protein DA1/LIM domain